MNSIIVASAIVFSIVGWIGAALCKYCNDHDIQYNGDMIFVAFGSLMLGALLFLISIGIDIFAVIFNA